MTIPAKYENGVFRPIEADTGAELLSHAVHRGECLLHGVECSPHLAAGTEA